MHRHIIHHCSQKPGSLRERAGSHDQGGRRDKVVEGRTRARVQFEEDSFVFQAEQVRIQSRKD